MSRRRLWLGSACYALAQWAFALGDAIFDLPPGVEARHYLGRQIVPPSTSYYDD